jgi:hypothetical protein
MEYFAQQLSLHGINVGRFNFPYMQLNKLDEGDRTFVTLLNEEFEEHFKSVLKNADKDLPLYIGGKSFGG